MADAVGHEMIYSAGSAVLRHFGTFRLAADLPSGQHARLWLNQDHHFAVIALPEPPLIVKPPLYWTTDAIVAFTAALAEANRKEPDHG